MPRSTGVHRILVGLLIGVAAILGPAAAWAFTATLSIPGLCASPITAQAFSVETSNTTTIGSATGGAGAGKATFKPIC